MERTDKHMALRVLRNNNKKPHVNKWTKIQNLDKIRAIEGLCGRCEHCYFKIQPQGVGVRCSSDRDPLTLYENTPYGQIGICDKFTQIVE